MAAASVKVAIFSKFPRFAACSVSRVRLPVCKTKLWQSPVISPANTYLFHQHRCFSTTSQYLVDAAIQKEEVVNKPDDKRKIINPLDHDDYFNLKDMFSLKDLFDARVHLGHRDGSRNEYMKPFVFGSRLGYDIIDLDQTVNLLHDALNFTAHIAFRKGIILFVSRNYQMLQEVEKTAFDCGEYSHCRFWQGGVFANSAIQFNAITRLPDLCIFVNTLNPVLDTHIGIRDAAKLNIPTIGILDTNCDPRFITYPVPGNDDSPSAVRLYLKLFKDVILRAKAKRKELEEQGCLIQSDME